MPLDRFARFSDLVELGFEPAPPDPITTQLADVPGHRTLLSQCRPAMGTLVSLTVVAESADRAEEAVGRALEEMDRVVGLLNRYDDRSALAVLNAEGSLRSAPPELHYVLDRSSQIHSATGRRFDVTVAPLVDLLRDRTSGANSGGELAGALERVGFEHVVASGPDIRLGRPDMRLTLDGIAKGFVVDAMARVLERHGVEDWLIDGGGDIRASGSPDSGRPWQVGVRDPTGDGLLPDVLHLTGGAVATSGGYEAFFDRNHIHHHIVEAETGASAVRNLGATVTAPDAMTADALATSVFLMEAFDGLRLIDSLPDCECLVVDATGTIRTSAGWRAVSPATSYGHSP